MTDSILQILESVKNDLNKIFPDTTYDIVRGLKAVYKINTNNRTVYFNLDICDLDINMISSFDEEESELIKFYVENALKSMAI